MERYFSGKIVVIRADGSRLSANVTADEIVEFGKAVYRISFEQGAELRVFESDIDFFETLKALRLDLERSGALLYCFGASEDVYPSGMQRSMGPAILAYRTRVGAPAVREDIVDIFEADEAVIPSTVEQQERFHERWINSLSSRTRS